MKNRIKAILLAFGLTLSMLGTVTVYAGEAATESAVEAATEVEVSDDASQDTAGGAYSMYYDSMKEAVPTMLSQLSAMTDEQLTTIMEGTDATSAAIAASWSNVKEELGTFLEVADQIVSEDGNVITVTSNAKYDGVDDKTVVTVDYVFDLAEQSTSISWNIDYPMSTLVKQAGMNTLMGIGIVFIVLLFLSFLISQIHWIPDLIEGRQKKKEAANAPAPAAAPAAPVVEEVEEEVDDGELIAVIAAAIAASENTSTDGFVVRSIRKANRKNWQNA